ncbi:SigE family RNA polymerase sigma factor [uncultured Friedmanniella sp.]|uniref:SigE family RNA polymerase sigma factor n=1 Tax=uncultured Friedmanniella sp. TaxID=335381 RepID=UPI0035CA1418
MSDQRADFTAFYDATWSRTVACAYAITGELGAAEDLAQEAYTRAWPRWSRISSYDEPAAWVRQVATRLAISSWRRGRVARAFLVGSREPDPVPGPDPDAVSLARALARLPVEQRRAVVLHHLGDLPVREVAQLEGCPEGTIKARLSRGRTALAALLGENRPRSTDGLEGSRV